MGNDEQWLPSASCSSDRAPVESASLGTRPIEHASVEPRMSNLVRIRSVCTDNISWVERVDLHQAI